MALEPASCAQFDHFDPRLREEFWDTMSTMRASCPVGYSESHGGMWVVTRYDDVVKVALDWESFSSAEGIMHPVPPGYITAMPLEIDPPAQLAYRLVIRRFLSPKNTAALEPQVRTTLQGLMDAFIPSGHCELMEDMARRFPTAVFCQHVMHIDDEDIPTVTAWLDEFVSSPEGAEAMMSVLMWLSGIVARRRAGERHDDILDEILDGEIDGHPITDEEALRMMAVIIAGGLETTANALGTMAISLATHPEQTTYLRDHPEAIPGAVEEFLRVAAPQVVVARTATRDVELGGQQIRKGDKVLIYWASANRDETRFAEADEVDFTRESNRHLSFGVGPHRCAGAHLARLMLSVALEEIIERMPKLRLQEGSEISYHHSYTRGPDAVPLVFGTR